MVYICQNQGDSMKKKQNTLNHLCEKHGIIRSWIAEKLGIHPSSLDDAEEAGFSHERVLELEGIFHAAGEELLKFSFKKWDNHQEGINHLRSNFGIKKAWLAAQLGVNNNDFFNISKRQSGLYPTEIEILEASLKVTAAAFLGFKVSENLLQKAA